MEPGIDPAKIKRILLVRTDRIGDVVVTTPVLPAIKKRYPNAHLALLASKDNADLVEGNPFLDEVILYDRQGREKSWWGTYQFARLIGKKQFDVAVHFNPRARAHWVSFLAGIPIRIGYRYKSHLLLTHSVFYDKGEGRKHEAEYNFDLLKHLDVTQPSELLTHVPLQEIHKSSIERRLNGIGRFVVLHPSASCPSKLWPAQNFAELADYTARKFQVMPVIIGGEKDLKQGRAVLNLMKSKAIDLCGQLKLGELAWLLKRAELLVSNDSGPVHIAAAVGTPVVTIFGRNLAGLNPARWRALGKQSWYIQKDVGCIECLAHLCPIEFKCLHVITVQDVIQLIESKPGIFQHELAR